MAGVMTREPQRPALRYSSMARSLSKVCVSLQYISWGSNILSLAHDVGAALIACEIVCSFMTSLRTDRLACQRDFHSCLGRNIFLAHEQASSLVHECMILINFLLALRYAKRISLCVENRATL
jgi:hypothetical protein